MRELCNKSLLLTTILGCLALSLTGLAFGQTGAVEAAAEKENLEKVDGSWTETWVNPDVDFTQYQ